jgi:predicted DNA-binding transcriptional regulator AlpA
MLGLSRRTFLHSLYSCSRESDPGNIFAGTNFPWQATLGSSCYGWLQFDVDNHLMTRCALNTANSLQEQARLLRKCICIYSIHNIPGCKFYQNISQRLRFDRPDFIADMPFAVDAEGLAANVALYQLPQVQTDMEKAFRKIEPIIRTDFQYNKHKPGLPGADSGCLARRMLR